MKDVLAKKSNLTTVFFCVLSVAFAAGACFCAWRLSVSGSFVALVALVLTLAGTLLDLLFLVKYARQPKVLAEYDARGLTLYHTPTATTFVDYRDIYEVLATLDGHRSRGTVTLFTREGKLELCDVADASEVKQKITALCEARRDARAYDASYQGRN